MPQYCKDNSIVEYCAW